jgi:hypothetical protein
MIILTLSLIYRTAYLDGSLVGISFGPIPYNSNYNWSHTNHLQMYHNFQNRHLQNREIYPISLLHEWGRRADSRRDVNSANDIAG